MEGWWEQGDKDQDGTESLKKREDVRVVAEG